MDPIDFHNKWLYFTKADNLTEKIHIHTKIWEDDKPHKEDRLVCCDPQTKRHPAAPELSISIHSTLNALFMMSEQTQCSDDPQ
ncbi:hypothetical protein F2P79_015491 [Pimephales promelas]|nr:hypothetical protein F2P79_015491 [Pimephales promelas]